MDSVKRDQLRSFVLRQLVHRDFAKRFERTNGRAQIVAALPDDNLAWLHAEVSKMGGTANVVTPFLEGLIVFSMQAAQHKPSEHDERPKLDGACTVGVLVERLIVDNGGGDYCVVLPEAGESSHVERPRLLQV